MRETRRRRKLSPKVSIEEEIAQLRDLDLKGLRVRWLNVFGKPAPEHLIRYPLFRIIAYRLQADVLATSMPRPSRCLIRLRGRKVRFIFCRYLEVSGINELVRDLKARSTPRTTQAETTGSRSSRKVEWAPRSGTPRS